MQHARQGFLKTSPGKPAPNGWTTSKPQPPVDSLIFSYRKTDSQSSCKSRAAMFLALSSLAVARFTCLATDPNISDRSIFVQQPSAGRLVRTISVRCLRASLHPPWQFRSKDFIATGSVGISIGQQPGQRLIGVCAGVDLRGWIKGCLASARGSRNRFTGTDSPEKIHDKDSSKRLGLEMAGLVRFCLFAPVVTIAVASIIGAAKKSRRK